MATLCGGRVMPSVEAGLSAGLDPNQGVSSEPQPFSRPLPAIESIFAESGIGVTFRASGVLTAVAGLGLVRRAKNPYSGARMGPFSRSAARKEQLPDFVHTVTMVRATSSGCVVYCCCLRHFDVLMYSS